VVLHGTGGIGKTQLALQYVYRHKEAYSSVFWINAANYTAIGRLLDMTGKLNAAGKFTVQEPTDEQHIVGAVKQWLAAKENNKWLLVIDNLDDLESFDLSDYIPQCCHGTVIITSRRPNCVHRRRGVEVSQMQGSEAEMLLVQS
ncbi:hypothetical protein L211DRAFT_769464, partial [Terfezia boudieri ATCC MYA-4762]